MSHGHHLINLTTKALQPHNLHLRGNDITTARDESNMIRTDCGAATYGFQNLYG